MKRRITPHTKVNARQRPWVTEEGTHERKAVPMYLDSTGTPAFLFLVPEYVQAAFGIDAELRNAQAESLEDQWSALVRRYVAHVKELRAEPVLILDVAYHAKDDKGYGLVRVYHGSSFDDSQHVMLQLSYLRAFRVNGELHHAIRRPISGTVFCTRADPNTLEDAVPGHRMQHVSKDKRVIPWTPESEAYVLAIAAAMGRAAMQLRDLMGSEDLVLALAGFGVKQLGGPQ